MEKTKSKTVVEKPTHSKQPIYQIISKTAWQHPYLFVSMLFVLTATFTMQSGSVLCDVVLPSVGVFALCIMALLHILHHYIQTNQKIILGSGIVFSGAIAVLFGMLLNDTANPQGFILNMGLAAIAGTFIFLGIKDKLTAKHIIVMLFAAAFLLRIALIVSLPMNSHQHDFGSSLKGTGHIGYIEYLYEHHHLFDGDPTTVYQFYHPPFHHILAATWLTVQTFLGIPYSNACENIQLLTMFYSMIAMVIGYKIFRQLNLHDKGLIFATAILVFSPTFILMGTDMNNDMLSVTFLLGAMLNMLKWLKNKRFRDIIGIALCIGLGMFTKLSVWMIAPAIGLLFIYIFFEDIKNFKKYLLQYLTFGVICIPIGLFWSVRNLIKFDVPLTYVPLLSKNSAQYIGNIPTMQRLFDFRLFQFENVGDQFTMYGGKYNEYNPLIALFKTSLFDEGYTAKNYPHIAGFNTILFWAAVILGVAGFVSMVYFMIKKNKELALFPKILIGITYIVLLGSYYVFCFDFPHVCTENIRYASPLVLFGAYFVGLAIQNLHCKDNRRVPIAVGNILCTATVVFCATSTILYDIVSYY